MKYSTAMPRLRTKMVLMSLLLSSATLADEVKPVAVIEAADAIELNRILNHETPPTWGQPIAAWFNAIAARQAARDKAEADRKAEAEARKPPPLDD